MTKKKQNGGFEATFHPSCSTCTKTILINYVMLKFGNKISINNNQMFGTIVIQKYFGVEFGTPHFSLRFKEN